MPPTSERQPTSGLPGLDHVFQGLRPGDNLVWLVDALDDFLPFAAPYCQAAAGGGELHYFRFAAHDPLVSAATKPIVHRLDPAEGFERFVAAAHGIIEQAAPGAAMVFDCLSGLADQWCSDRMLGNFFMLVCPLIAGRRATAYFPLLRQRHSFHASTPIAQTAQILLDVYRHNERLYIHPLKVQGRYSATMHLLHCWEERLFRPVTESSTTAEILAARPWAGLESIRLRLGKWTSTFLRAEECWEAARRGERPVEDAARLAAELIRMAVTRDGRLARLAGQYLETPDLLDIWRRMIGTGQIGGKAVGMIVARAILKKSHPRWKTLLEAHDSFFIGSDVFCSFLVENDCWWLRQQQRDPARFLDGIDEARRRILDGRFPDYLLKEFSEMLDYFGQAPIIVRSSSLLEDGYGNAFAGKYDSVFCPNQGPHRRRLQEFLAAVKTIYASSVGEKALRYRAQRGLLDRDEQMSLLVQRVSGVGYGSLFYPQIAGVALSRNPYVWHESIDPAAGVMRLVFGLGTRAVDRCDDDYTRIVALNDPRRRPDGDPSAARRYAQRKADLIDLEANQFVTRDFRQVAARSFRLPIRLLASDAAPRTAATAAEPDWVLDFEQLLSETEFVADMREMLQTLQTAYDYPVDVEFTANFLEPGGLKINLVQCRPLQLTADRPIAELPRNIPPQDIVLRARGAVIGQSRLSALDRVVYVAPSVYAAMPLRDRYSIARLIGRIMHLEEPTRPRQVMLIGPGRWGTTTPALGVPVSFAEIDAAAALCEIVAMREDLVPDVSLGTHFFNDLVERDVLYMALFPGREGNGWRAEFFERAENRLAELLPDEARWAEAVRVLDLPLPDSAALLLSANALTQEATCFIQRP